MTEIRTILSIFILKFCRDNLLHLFPFQMLYVYVQIIHCWFNDRDLIVISKHFFIHVNARLFIRLLLTLIVIISMFIFYSNKCICTSVLFVFLSTFPSWSYRSYLHQLVLLLLHQSRSSESPDVADLTTSFFRPLIYKG